jgi:hypothetical protein
LIGDATDYFYKVVLDRFNASSVAIDFHLMKRENYEEEGEHMFIKSNLKKKLKVFTNKKSNGLVYGDYVKVVTEEDTNLVLSTMKSLSKIYFKENLFKCPQILHY